MRRSAPNRSTQGQNLVRKLSFYAPIGWGGPYLFFIRQWVSFRVAGYTTRTEN